MSNLKRIWTGMLTNEGRWDGSRNRTVLIINQRGKDQLHHTFPKGEPAHQERGQANLYEIDVMANEIDTERLNTSSIRMGLRGQDYWRPQNVMVWGELAENNQIIPLAGERDLTVKVSHDPKEGVISFPLHSIGAGADDMTLTHLILMIKTSEIQAAETKGDIRLQIMSHKKMLVDYQIEETLQVDNHSNSAFFCVIRLEEKFSKTILQANSIRLVNNGFDSWLPKSCFLFGYNEKARRSESLVTLVHLFEWSFGWLSSHEKDHARRSVALPLFSEDNPLKGNGKRESTQVVNKENKETNKEKREQMKAEKERKEREEREARAERKEMKEREARERKEREEREERERKERKGSKEWQASQRKERKEREEREEREARAQRKGRKEREERERKEGKGNMRAEKKEANKEKREEMRAERKEEKNENRQERQQIKAERKDTKGKKHENKIHSKNGSQHSKNGHSKTSQRKTSKSKSHKQSETQGQWVYMEESSSSKEETTATRTRELASA